MRAGWRQAAAAGGGAAAGSPVHMQPASHTCSTSPWCRWQALLGRMRPAWRTHIGDPLLKRLELEAFGGPDLWHRWDIAVAVSSPHSATPSLRTHREVLSHALLRGCIVEDVEIVCIMSEDDLEVARVFSVPVSSRCALVQAGFAN